MDVWWQYQGLFGSDDKIQGCMAELGVPLTKEPEFHQVRLFSLDDSNGFKTIWGKVEKHREDAK